VRNLNVLDLMKYKYVVIENPKVSVASLASRLPARAEGVAKKEVAKKVAKVATKTAKK